MTADEAAAYLRRELDRLAREDEELALRIHELEGRERTTDSWISGSRAVLALVLILVGIFGVAVANLVITDQHAAADTTQTIHRETDILTLVTSTVTVYSGGK